MAGNNWQVLTQPGPAFPGGTTVGGGAIPFRDSLDARRSMSGRTPEAEYPDGYLGTITDRHQDKVLGKVKERLTDRSYQRGVHVGSTVGQRAYFWGNGTSPQAGLLREAQFTQGPYTMDVPRYAPSGNPVEKLAHMGKTAGLTPPEQMEIARKYGVNPAINPVVNPDPTRRARMQKMLPGYV
jgi:hypothetical protein